MDAVMATVIIFFNGYMTERKLRWNSKLISKSSIFLSQDMS